jgi:CRP/FNR family transcriptional regulator/CRP/FNR family cyclic AMP-dependent transcriptional regulator
MGDQHPLAQQALFRDIPAREMDVLARLVRPVHLGPGQVLFRKGDPPGDVYFLVGGGAQVVAEGAARDEVVARIGPGESIGEMAALDGQPRSATVLACEETDAYALSAESFARFLEGAPAVAGRLLRLLSTRLRQMVSDAEGELLLAEVRRP